MGPKFLGEIQIDRFPLYEELGQEKQVLAPKERTNGHKYVAPPLQGLHALKKELLHPQGVFADRDSGSHCFLQQSAAPSPYHQR